MSPQLVVNDLEHTIEFYKKQLDFDVDFRYEDFYAGIVKDGYSIHLKSGNAPNEAIKNNRNDEDPVIVFSVDNIEVLYEELSGKPVDITQPLRHMPYGKEFYIRDPNHYLLAFLGELY